jgi:hypothetical protein
VRINRCYSHPLSEDSFLKSSRVNFNISTRITIDNQQFPKIKNRAIFGSPEVAGRVEVLRRT